MLTTPNCRSDNEEYRRLFEGVVLIIRRLLDTDPFVELDGVDL